MELTNENNKIYFDPTPKLKSSPIPILFIPFNNEKHNCYNCENKYSVTNLYEQKYCKKCLLSYIKNMTDNNTYLDVHIHTNNTNNTQCIEHIQRWCENCLEILYFRNYYDPINTTNQYKFMKEDCRLCGKLFNKNSSGFKICSDCYIISSGWIKSNFTNRYIPILYLPWWDTSNKSGICNHNLKFTSNCQKWCSICFIIYIGCRYCLTTNIIFGIARQTQCKKCHKISDIDIDITNISNGNHYIDEFLVSTRTNINSHHEIANYMNSVDNNSHPLNVYNFIKSMLKDINSKRIIEWIPYSQITDSKEIAAGGYGIIYKAIWLNKTSIAVKRFTNSRDISHFLNELKSLHKCYDSVYIIKYYGISQDPEIKDYMLIMEYADGGNLHRYLKKKFINLKWITKIAILRQITDGLKTIHNENFIHRDFHSGNILSLKGKYKNYNKWVIADLGLSQPANNTSLNNDIYGVVPYVAPEIFKGAVFSKESDIYSLGMIMWELTTGCKPFANIEHDGNLICKIVVDGKRPEITNDTPKCFVKLMKKCWSSDPLKRPSIQQINNIVHNWYKASSGIFNEADKKRLELIQSKKLGPEFTETPHSGAIYTSRCLNSFISRFSSVNSSSTIPKQSKQEYKLNIDITQRPTISKFSKPSSINSSGYISNDLDFDIKSSKSSSGYISNDLELDIDTNV